MKTSNVQGINFKAVTRQFVPNFVSYVSAKYYLNWFTVGEVIAKIKRVNFFSETQCIQQYINSTLRRLSYVTISFLYAECCKTVALKRFSAVEFTGCRNCMR